MKRDLDVVWTALLFEPPIAGEAARAALGALAGLSGQPRIVLEATGKAGRASWRLGCDRRARSRVLDALRAQLPSMSIEVEATPDHRSDEAPNTGSTATVRFRNIDAPLNADATEQAARGLLGALARTKQSEVLRIQLILGPRSRPRRSISTDAAIRRRADAKLGEYGFGCSVRIGATAATAERERSLIGSAVGALRPMEAPGAWIRATSAWRRSFDRAGSPFLWPNRLNLSELTPLTAWPISRDKDPQLPGVPAPHPRRLRPDHTVARTGRIVGMATGSSPYGTDRPVALTVSDSLRHLHVIGPTGVGKSTMLGQLALQDIDAGRGVVVVDPKGDLVDDILARVPAHRRDDVVVLDATDQTPIGINPLAGSSDPDLTADVLLGMFHSLYADAWGPRTHDVLHASLLTLARRGDASIAMIPLVLSNPGFRRSIVGQVNRRDPLGLGGFWASWDQLSEAERLQATAPLMRRLRPILMRPGVRAVLAQRQPKFDIGDVFSERRIFLVSLAKGVIGPEAAELVGSIVVSQLWTHVLARSAQPAPRRDPVMIYVDEVQDYLRLPGDLGDALAQARGLGVGYTLAHQHLGQLPRPLLSGVMANARSRVAFQLAPDDARTIAATTGGRLIAADFEALPAYHAYAHLLHDNQPGAWTSIVTRDLPKVRQPAAELRRQSAATYGQPIDAVEADLLSLVEPDRPADEPIGRVRRRVTEQAERPDRPRRQTNRSQNDQKGGSS